MRSAPRTAASAPGVPAMQASIVARRSGGEGAGVEAIEERADGGVAGEVGAEDQRRLERADPGRGRGRGRDGGELEVVLPGVAAEDHGERGEAMELGSVRRLEGVERARA